MPRGRQGACACHRVMRNTGSAAAARDLEIAVFGVLGGFTGVASTHSLHWLSVRSSVR